MKHSRTLRWLYEAAVDLSDETNRFVNMPSYVEVVFTLVSFEALISIHYLTPQRSPGSQVIVIANQKLS